MNNKYIIPKMTDISLMITFLEKIKNKEMKYSYKDFVSEFKASKNKLNFVANSTLSNTINRTYNFLKNINAIIETEKGMKINKELVDPYDIKYSFENFLKKEFTKYIKEHNLKNKEGNIDKEKVKSLTRKILEENKQDKNKELSDNYINRDYSYFYNFLNLINEEDFSIPLMYTKIEEQHYVSNTKEDKLNMARQIILGLANIKDVSNQNINEDTKLKILKRDILSNEFLDQLIEKNYNGDVNLFLDDIQLKDIPEPDYANIIENVDIAKDKIISYLENGYKVLVLTDSDNDGSNALVGANRISKYLQEKYKYKFRADYAKVVQGSVVNHGPNFAHLEEMRKNKVFDKDDKILIITADSFSNSQVEADLILKNYSNAEIIATDHHSPKEGMKTLSSDRVTIVNYLHKSKKEELNGFGISGAHTFNVLMIEFLKELPEDEQKEYIIQQLDSLNRHSNFMDMVHAHPASRIKTISTAKSLAKNSNLMNAVMTMLPLWNESDNITPEYFEKTYFADKTEALSMFNDFSYIVKESEIINKVYNKILRNKYEDNNEVKNDLLESLNHDFEIDNGYKSFPTPMYLRTIMLDFITKNSLTSQEQMLYEYMTEINGNFLMKIKNFEKKLMSPLKKRINEISYKIEDENAKIICVNTKKQKEGGNITRKFYLKTIPQSNDGVLMIFDTVKEKELKGSIRMVGSYKFNDIFNPDSIENVKLHNKIMNEMIKEGILSENILKENGLNLSINVVGHEEGAAGIYITSEEEITKGKLKLLTKLISNKFKEMENRLGNKQHLVFDKLWLNDILKIMTVLKFPTISSGHCFKPDIYVKADTVPFTQGVETLAMNEELAKKIEKIAGWEIAPLNFEGNTMLAKTEDLKKINKNNYFKLNFMSPTTFICNNIETLSTNLKFIPYVNKLNQEQFKEYDRLFNKNNNYTIPISKKEFIDKNPVMNVHYEIFEKALIELLVSTNKEEFVIVDTEGTGFGNFAKLFNIGMTRFVLSKDKKNIGILNTNIIIDPETDISIAAEALTGISNDDIKKRGVSNFIADKILEKEFKNKDCLYSAHNATYDISIIMSSLPKFAKIVNENLVVDTAPIAREENLAFDERETFGSVTIKHKEEIYGDFKTFLLTEGDENNAINFFSYPVNKKSISNLGNDIKFEWEWDNIAGKHLLIKREIEQDNKKIIIGSEENIDFSYKNEYKAKKYSVVAMLMQTMTNIIKSKFDKEIIPNKGLGNYVTHYQFIDKNITKILDKDLYLFTKPKEDNKSRLIHLFDYKEAVKYFQNISEEDIQNNLEGYKIDVKDKEKIIEFRKDIAKMKKTDNYEERYNDKYTKFAKSFIEDKFSQFIDKFEDLTFSSNKFSFSTSIKKVIELHNSNLTLAENVFNIKKESSNLSEEFIKDIIHKIEALDKEMETKPGYSDLLKQYKVNSFTDLFHENHNNIEPFLSDTTLEGTSIISNILSKYQEDYTKISEIYMKEMVSTESKKVLRNLRNVPSINTFSFSQLLVNDSKTDRLKQNRKNIEELLENDMAIVKLSEDAKILVKLHEGYAIEDLEKVGKRIYELGKNIYDYQVFINTYNKRMFSIFKDIDVEANSENSKIAKNYDEFESKYGIGKTSDVYLTDLKEKFKENLWEANPKSGKTNEKKIEKANETIEFLMSLNNKFSLFTEVYEKSAETLKTICDYSIMEKPEDNTKILLEMITTVINNSIDYKMNEKTPEDYEGEKEDFDLVKNVSSEISKFLSPKKFGAAPISEDSYKELEKELKFYFKRLLKSFNDKEIIKVIEKTEELVFSTVQMDRFYNTSEVKEVEFKNDMNNLEKTSNSEQYKLLLKTYKQSIERLYNTQNLLPEEEKIFELPNNKIINTKIEGEKPIIMEESNGMEP